MLCSDQLIVFSYTRFSDSTIILHTLSREHGRLSLMAFGLGGKGKTKLGAFHPMALLDVEFSLKAGREIQKLKEYKINPLLISCTSDIRKSVLLQFLAEITLKCVREESPDKTMFDFIATSVKMLEHLDTGLAVFHHAYLVKLSRYLGFAPGDNQVVYPFFDLILGHEVPEKPKHNHFVARPLFEKMYALFSCNYENLDEIIIDRETKGMLLETILSWYSFHVSGFNKVHSYSVLKEVFSGR